MPAEPKSDKVRLANARLRAENRRLKAENAELKKHLSALAVRVERLAEQHRELIESSSGANDRLRWIRARLEILERELG